MRTPPRWLVGAAALAVLAGCVPSGSPSQPAASPTAPAATPSGPVIGISQSTGFEVDRPRLPASQARPDGFTDPPAGEGLAGYAKQAVDWQICAERYQCASIVAPLDYANPSVQAITLALTRKPATKAPKLGTLFINPGGPGGSGRNLVASFASTGLEQYDIVGWDPRGTNGSTPVTCFDDDATDAYNQLDSSPDDAAETQALIVGTYQFAKSCWEHSGELLNHISTIDTARDLDLMRSLLGDDKLSYLGYSYGTQIGAVYADLFPQRTGRLVLDAAVDITDDDTVIQAMGFDLALGNFASWCARQNCSNLGASKDAVLTTVTELLDRLDAQPLQVNDRRLTQSLATSGIALYMYGGIPEWKTLAEGVRSAIDGDGARLLRSSDGLKGRREDGSYGSRYYSFPAIGCADSRDSGVLGAERRWVENKQKAPIYGKYFGPGYTCALWPVRSAPQFQPTGSGAPPIVVIGATGDPATPYQNAVTMAKQLTSGVLLTYEGEGHGAFGGKSSCIDSAVIGYLTQGTVPADGTRCR